MLKAPDEPPFQGRNSLAIAIAGCSVTCDVRQRHVAFLYRNSTNSPFLLHLGWHHIVTYEPWPARDYSWLELSGLDPELQELFVDWVEIIAVWSKNGTHPIPYSAFFRPTGNFDSKGHFIDQHDGTGLTCATFILAMFADYELPLIDVSTWPKRAQDFAWLLRIFRRLKRYFKNKGWLDAGVPTANLLRADLLRQFFRRRELKRFRPEEVISAGSIFKGAPLPFNNVDAQVAVLEPSLPR